MRVLFVVFMWTLNIIATKTTDLRACENLNFDDDIWGRTSNTNWGLNYQETQKKTCTFHQTKPIWIAGTIPFVCACVSF